jgi:protein gp37
MGDGTKIEWAEASWNPIRARDRNSGKLGWFCEIITPGCENCYAQGINRRLGTGLPYLRGLRGGVQVFLDEKILTLPLRWKLPRRIFVCSMSDLFGEFVSDEMLYRIFDVMEQCPHHTFQILTKRAPRMRDWFREQDDLIWSPNPPPSWIWAGVSVEDQRRADERIPLLLDTPAAVRWISAEPLLEGIDIARYLRRMVVRPNEELTERMIEEGWSHPGGQGDHPGIDWVVVGGES